MIKGDDDTGAAGNEGWLERWTRPMAQDCRGR